MRLPPAITEIIAANGSVSVARYMQICASHYYATRDPFGQAGDFTTAPEISQIFGELVGAWLMHQWQSGQREASLLCELGPGRGTLMQDMLRVMRNHPFYNAVSVHLVENSPVLRALQQQKLKSSHPLIHWHETVDNLPPSPLFLIANEFFDALPIEQYVGFAQRNIILDQNGLAFSPQGEVTRETSLLSAAIMRKISVHIQRYGGAALIIDYGYESNGYKDTLQALKQHAFISPLIDPGNADITAHVDFNALKTVALGAGAQVYGAVRQGNFLSALGAELRAAALCGKTADPDQQKAIMLDLQRLIAPQQMGELFKVIAVTSLLDVPAGF